MSVQDARAAIRNRMDADHARVAVVWGDGDTDLFEVDPASYDVRPGGAFVGRTTDGDRLILSPATEWVLLDGA